MIRQSESVVKLSAAFVAAQAEMMNAPKETKGQVGSQIRFYTDLPTLTDLVRPILARHALAFTQLPAGGGDGTVTLTTRLLHESGEWIEDDYTMPGGSGAQGIGSALTYARRYALMALLGVAADDDDGAAASTQQARPRAARKAAAAPADDVAPKGTVTDPQISKMVVCFGEIGIRDRDERLAYIAKVIGRNVGSSKELSRAEAGAVIDALEAEARPPGG